MSGYKYCHSPTQPHLKVGIDKVMGWPTPRASKSWYPRYPGYWVTFSKIIKIEEHFKQIYAFVVAFFCIQKKNLSRNSLFILFRMRQNATTKNVWIYSKYSSNWWFLKMFLSIQDTEDTSFWKLCATVVML